MDQPNQSVLVTGATGFLGSAVLPRLLSNRQTKVYAIVRAAGHTALETRRQKYLAHLPATLNPDQLIFLNGDLTQPSLGLKEADLRTVYDRVSSILHMAASTRFDLTREQAQAINIEGGREVAALARQLQHRGRFRRLDYVSTCYVAGCRKGRIYEHECDEGQAFRNNYEWSKAMAEMHLRKEMADGLRVAVHRPSIIVGDSDSGAAASFSALYIPVMVYYRGWWRTLPGNPDSMLDLVPVNYVANAILKLRANEKTVGKTFHLAAGDAAITIEDVVARLNMVIDAPPVRYINPDTWRTWIHRPMIPFFSLSKGGRATRRVIESFLPYFTYNPQFDTTMSDRFLGDLRPPSALDYFERVLRYAVEKDFAGAE